MIPAFLLILATVAYRIATGLMIHSGATWLSNFTPLAAIALCGAACFPAKWKFTVPLLALLVSDIVLDLHYGVAFADPSLVVRYFALVLVGGLGSLLEGRATLKLLLPASILGSAIFYLLTNAACWLTTPEYAKTAAGLVQALTVGLPEYSATPTWMFFRNSVVSDLFFTALFVACMSFGRASARSTSAAVRAAAA